MNTRKWLKRGLTGVLAMTMALGMAACGSSSGQTG